MLKQNTFLKGIKYLNAYYTNFNFNINDNMKLEIWYNIFKETEDETYTNLVKNIVLITSTPHKVQHTSCNTQKI